MIRINTKIKVFTVIVFLLLANIQFAPVTAFKPNDNGHLGITSEAMKATDRILNGEKLQFTSDAIKEVNKANEDTDCISCQGQAELHFDDEAFGAATLRLYTLREAIVSALYSDTPDGKGARQMLGGALHTLQDFYAHTNWIELGERGVVIAGISTTGIDTRLGQEIYDGPPLNFPTSPADDPSVLLTDLDVLTSGWFAVPLCVPPAGKTRHGVPVVCPDGLNKDDNSRPGFAAAYARAVLATKDFLNQILDDERIANDPKAIKALMGLDSGMDISFVIDTTGSMADDIEAVKVSATQIVNSVASTRSDVRFSIVLYRDAGDIYISTTLLDFTKEPASVVSAINSITVDGGGDEPEAVYSGLMHSIGLVWNPGAEKSIIWMGDAPPHDPDPNGYTYAQVEAAAKAVDPKAPIIISENDDAPSIASTGGMGSYLFGTGTGRFSLAGLVAHMMPSAQISPRPIHIYPIVIGNSTSTLTVMQALANATGGQLFQAETASDVVGSILKALGVILSRITVPTTNNTPSSNSSPVALPLCADVAGNTNPIVRANIPSNTVSSGGVYCHVIAQNGQFNPAQIGNQNVLNLGVRHAVDVFSLDNGGSPITRFNGVISVCLQGNGSLIFLDAQQSPRVPKPLAVQSSGGFTCANLQTAGTLVLVNANVSSPAAPANPAPATSQMLTNCTVTTTNMVNLRTEPNTSSAEMTVLPYNISYQATEHVPGWYRIIYLNTQGWVSESYVHTQGNCG